MKKILLTRGKFALVDDSDYEWLNQYKWQVRQNKSKTYYAVHTMWDSTYIKSHQLSMHRLILGLDFGDKRECDHIDRDGLNNQRKNLRICSHRQNSYNQKSLPNSNSIYKGVYLNSRGKVWQAYIGVNYKSISLGRFHSQEEAAQAYNKAALKYFGEFARLNSLIHPQKT